MTKKNNGSGRLKDGFDNYVRNQSLKYNMPQETILNIIEQMIARKRKELGVMDRMNDAEAIEFLYDLLETTDHKVRHKEAVEYAVDAIEKQSMVNEFLNEAEQYKLALFDVVRNKIIRDTFADGFGLEVNNVLAVKAIKTLMEQCDFETMKKMYEEALAKMGGK